MRNPLTHEDAHHLLRVMFAWPSALSRRLLWGVSALSFTIEPRRERLRSAVFDSRIHACCSSVVALGRVFGSRVNIWIMMSFACSETPAQYSSWNSYQPDVMASNFAA